MWREYIMSEARVEDGARAAAVGPYHEASASYCKDFDFHSELR